MSSRGRFGPLVGAIDEGTSSARFLVFVAETAEVLTFHQLDIKQICPQEGWVEQDPFEILHSTIECINVTVDNLRKLDINPNDIVATGITNQRETTLVWDPVTGEPLYNAIVWLDVRTKETVNKLIEQSREKNAECIKHLCGLPISTYFSGTKLRWLIDNVPKVADAIGRKRCLFGTVDSWLIWNLTGGPNGGLHITDVTNASRTMLMNIKTLQWDDTLCKFFSIPKCVLPKIKSCSEIYGYLTQSALTGVPISGCLGDQQSALVGQMCFKQGQAKNTYGTGCFLLYNTGKSLVFSQHGLLTTVGYKMGINAPTIYALEGSIAVAGAAVRWLKDNLNILDNVADSRRLAQRAHPIGEVIFVPAFSGLYAPYWRKDARSVICGLTEETSKEHLIRAVLEAVCYQTRDILEAMNQDCGIPLTKLLVDGGMTANDFLMQQQADLCGIPVIRPSMTETTALGAAMAAGSAEGINVWNMSDVQSVPCDTFLPLIPEDERDFKYSRWKMGIERSLGWDVSPETISQRKYSKHNIQETISRSLPGVFFLFTSGVVLLVAKLRMQQ